MAVVPLGYQLVPTYLGPAGATAASVLNFINIGGDYDTDAGDGILGLWEEYWAGVSSSDWAIDTSAVWRDMTTDPADELFATGSGRDGDSTSDAAPAQCCVVASLSAGGGRRRKGRVYLPGLSLEYILSSAILLTALVEYVADEYVTFATACGVNHGFLPAVYSRLDGVVHPVTGVSADDVIDTQRRRGERLAT